MAGPSCAPNPTNAEMNALEKKFEVIAARLKGLNVDTHGLTKEEVLATIS